MIRTVYGPRFLRHKIPYINIIGFASDGANVMMGAKNSVKSRLKAESCLLQSAEMYLPLISTLCCCGIRKPINRSRPYASPNLQLLQSKLQMSVNMLFDIQKILDQLKHKFSKVHRLPMAWCK